MRAGGIKHPWRFVSGPCFRLKGGGSRKIGVGRAMPDESWVDTRVGGTKGRDEMTKCMI